jgi:LPXTG-site transpeptidase (sortase) family protein
MKRSVSKSAQSLFLWFGIAALVYAGGKLGYAGIYQRYLAWSFDNDHAKLESDTDSDIDGSFKPGEGDIVGRLEVPSVGISVMVLEGTDENTLASGAGHLPSSPLPGRSGNVAIAAHRDTFFRNLKTIKKGDAVRVVTLRHNFDYVVDSVKTVDPEDVRVLESRKPSELTLITCYPFYFVGNAPKRFIVHAIPKGSARIPNTETVRSSSRS